MRFINATSSWKLTCAALLAAAFALADSALAETTAQGPIHFRVTGYKIEGLTAIDAIDTSQLFRKYLGEELDLDRVRDAALVLQELLHTRGYSLARVIVPEQTLDGEVTLSVINPILSTVNFVPLAGTKSSENAQLVSAETVSRVRRILPSLVEGAPLNVGVLARNVTLANENSSRTLDVQIGPAAEQGAVTAEVGVSERNPWVLTGILNNTGAKEPASSRLTISLSDSRLFDTDQTLTLSGTTSPEATSSVSQYGLAYRLPLYSLGGTFSAYGFYSNSQSNPAGGFFTVQGEGHFYGVAYSHQFAPNDRWRDSLTIALDDRLITDQSNFSGKTIGTPVRTRPVTATYSGRLTSAADMFGVNVAVSHNIQSGTDNDAYAYEQVRSGASPDWDALRINFEASKQFARGVATAKFGGQFSSGVMLPAEAFGIGGQDSIRALEPRQLAGDSGCEIELQWNMPTSIPSMTAHVFSDNGLISRRGDQAGTPAFERVAAYGAGMAWVTTNLSLSLDYGYVYSGSPTIPDGTQRVYAEMRATF